LIRKLRAVHALAFAGLTAMPIAVLGAKSLSVLLVLTAILVAVSERRGLLGRIPVGLASLIAALVLWGALTALWSLDPSRGIGLALKLAAHASAGLIVLAGARGLGGEDVATLERALLIGTAVGATLLGIEILGEGCINNTLRQALHGEGTRFVYSVAFNRTAAVLAILTWLVVLVLLRRRAWVAALAAVAVAFFLLTRLENAAAVLGLVVGAVVLAAAYGNLDRTVRTLTALVILGGLSAPFLAASIGDGRALGSITPSLNVSQLHRLFIWRFAGEHTLVRPFGGWGLDASRAMPGRGTEVGADVDAMQPSDNAGGGLGQSQLEALPLHPHNAMLQIWLELGLPGALIALGIVALAFVRLRRLGVARAEGAAAAALVAAVLVIALLSYGIWQTWWLSVLWLAGAFLVGVSRDTPGRASLPREP
jgi:O-antigen ligase